MDGKEGGAVLAVFLSVAVSLSLVADACLACEAAREVEGERLEKLKRYGLRRR